MDTQKADGGAPPPDSPRSAFTHETAFTQRSAKQVLSTVGFEEIEVGPVPPVPETWKGRHRVFLWKVMQTFYRLLLFSDVGRDFGIVTLDIIAAARRPRSA